METELWLTRIFNDNLAGLGNSLLSLVGMPGQPRPWANFITMQILVVAFLVIVFAILRGRLSYDRPGKLQHIFELIYEFVHGQTEDQMGHSGGKYMTYFATIFIFILFCNLIGLIPGFEAPTMNPSVPAGCAILTFLYYNGVGIRANGALKYAAHFAGPVWWLAPLMIPIEIVSHLARPLSLTIRLYANMFAGEKLTMVFLSLTYLFVPAAFMGLHFFVALLQAYIFMLLTMIYVGGATAHDH
ncbi:MAG TPA: F0F1 ATP synthase subunit A [Bryobacteraceae bacterium]|nr:F0F1 ATP synthase subunit A [Bryobacteraceae bacterium]